MSFDMNPRDDDPHGECAHAIAEGLCEIKQCRALLGRVYEQFGNHLSAEKRHRMTPGLRDDIRDYLKTTGYFNRSPVCETDCGDGSTMYDDRPRPGA